MLDQIRASREVLCRSEQRVAAVILERHRRIGIMTIADVADEAHVSKPTVVRFCRKLGYLGFTDFKAKLLHSCESNGGVQLVHRSLDERDKSVDILSKVTDAVIASMFYFRELVSTEALDAAVSLIVDTQRCYGRVFFFGIGNSSIVARDARHKFLRLSLSCIMFEDIHEQLIGASLCSSSDVVVLFSNSGRTKEIIEIANVARKSGAHIISVTASGTALEEISEVHLSVDHFDGSDRYLPAASRILHLLMVDILALGVALKLGVADMHDKLYAIQSILKTKRHL